VRPGLRTHPPRRHPLNPLVADGGGGAQALVHDAALEQTALVGRVGPCAGQAVRLELQLNPGVGLDPGQRLNVVGDRVSDDVGLGEVASRPELGVDGLEEVELEVQAPVAGTVERPRFP
jgi:hypothetical protein